MRGLLAKLPPLPLSLQWLHFLASSLSVSLSSFQSPSSSLLSLLLPSCKMSQFVNQSVCQSLIYNGERWPVCLSVYLSVCQPVHSIICPFIQPSFSLFVCPRFDYCHSGRMSNEREASSLIALLMRSLLLAALPLCLSSLSWPGCEDITCYTPPPPHPAPLFIHAPD